MNYQIMDNPEQVTLVNPGGATMVTNYAFRRQNIHSHMDQSGLMKIETITRWLVFKTNITPFVPEINCRINALAGDSYYVNEIENVAQDSYYVLHSSRIV